MPGTVRRQTRQKEGRQQPPLPDWRLVSKRALIITALCGVVAGCGSSHDASTTVARHDHVVDHDPLDDDGACTGADHRHRLPGSRRPPRRRSRARAGDARRRGGIADRTRARSPRLDLRAAPPRSSARRCDTRAGGGDRLHADPVPEHRARRPRGKTGLTRADVARFLPPILVERPAAGATTGQTIAVSRQRERLRGDGRARAPAGGQGSCRRRSSRQPRARLGAGRSRARSSRPTRGTTSSPPTRRLPMDGSPQHEQDVPVTVTP